MDTTQSLLEKSVRQLHSRASQRREAIRISKETHGFIQPLIDWYQFRSRETLSQFIADQLTFVTDFAFEEMLIEYRTVQKYVYGAMRHLPSGNLRRLNSHMRMMLEAAKTGKDDFVTKYDPLRHMPTYERRKKIPHGRRDYFLPNREPLEKLVGKAVKEFTCHDNSKVKESVESLLENKDRVQSPLGMVDRVTRAYGFASPEGLNGLLREVAEIEGRIKGGFKLKNLKGKIISPRHRKLFAVAAVLDYAAKNGMKQEAINAVLNRERQASLRQGSHFEYLIVSRNEYMGLIREFGRKGLPDRLIGSIIGYLFGHSIESAVTNYVSGDNNLMSLRRYLRLQEFKDKMLPYTLIIDLTDPKKRREEYARFIRKFKGGRVVVKTEHLVYVNNRLNAEHIPMLERIAYRVRMVGGSAFLFPSYKQVHPELTGFQDYKNLLKGSIFDLLNAQNKINSNFFS